MLAQEPQAQTTAPKSLLVALRHEDVRTLLTHMPDLRVIRASDSYEALDLCMQTHFDLIIAHENSGELTGWDLLSMLDSTPYHPEVPAVIVIENRANPGVSSGSSGDVLVLTESELGGGGAISAIKGLVTGGRLPA
ncbi:MAG: hypothetical protein ACPGUF_00555 [Litorivicinus sp.]